MEPIASHGSFIHRIVGITYTITFTVVKETAKEAPQNSPKKKKSVVQNFLQRARITGEGEDDANIGRDDANIVERADGNIDERDDGRDDGTGMTWSEEILTFEVKEAVSV
ncbi:hypothetical protein ACFE04_011354 [Oxalis oulophora]